MSQLQVTATKTGYVYNRWGTWAGIRAGSSGNAVSGILLALVDSVVSDGAYGITRAFATFDTSALPDTCTISAATLDLHQNDSFTGASCTAGVYVVTNSQASNTDLVNEDYDQIGETSLGNTGLNSGAGYAISISIPTTNISKTGYTKLALRQYHDYANSAPASQSGETRQAFDGTANTYPARLTITYTTAPVVTTGSATDIASVTATLGGNVTDAGGGTVSARGVCWSLSANPTTSDSKATSAGSTGAYTVSATGLIAGALYHYRAYVTTENSTTYGSDETFRTIFGGNFIPFL